MPKPEESPIGLPPEAKLILHRISPTESSPKITAEIEEFADIYFELTNQRLPVDLNPLVKFYPIVKEIRYTNSKFRDGSLWNNHDGTLTMEIRSDQPKMEFSMGHEIGHLWNGVGQKSSEEISNQFSRTILAPRSLVLTEIQKLKDKDPLVLFAQLYRKTKIPPDQLAIRLVEDLSMNLNLIVFAANLNSDGKPRITDRCVISSHPSLPNKKEWVHGHGNLLGLSDYGNYHLFRLVESEPTVLDDILLLVEDHERKGWIHMWRSQAKGICVGAGNKEDPKFGIINVQPTDLVASVADIGFLSTGRNEALNLSLKNKI